MEDGELMAELVVTLSHFAILVSSVNGFASGPPAEVRRPVWARSEQLCELARRVKRLQAKREQDLASRAYEQRHNEQPQSFVSAPLYSSLYTSGTTSTLTTNVSPSVLSCTVSAHHQLSAPSPTSPAAELTIKPPNRLDLPLIHPLRLDQRSIRLLHDDPKLPQDGNDITRRDGAVDLRTGMHNRLAG